MGVDVITSGWPLFGFFDLLARLINKVINLESRMDIDGMDYAEPFPAPNFLCSAEISEDGQHTRLHVKHAFGRSNYASSEHWNIDVDACSLLGISVARFHAARAEFRRLRQQRNTDFYVPLSNWTSVCRGPRSLGTNPQADCSEQTREACIAVDESQRPVPLRCMRLRRHSGASIRVRRSNVLFASRANNLIFQGERLLREFVQRYGLYAAVWAAGKPELAPMR